MSVSSKLLSIAVWSLCVLTCSVFGQVKLPEIKQPSKPLKKEYPKQERIIPTFRYIIYGNEPPESKRNRLSGEIVQVLIEPDAFTPENLQLLMKMILRRYSYPSKAYIHVDTNIQQTKNPEETDFIMSDVPDGRDKYSHMFPTAVLMSVDGRNSINYIDLQTNKDWKTIKNVVIK